MSEAVSVTLVGPAILITAVAGLLGLGAALGRLTWSALGEADELLRRELETAKGAPRSSGRTMQRRMPAFREARVSFALDRRFERIVEGQGFCVRPALRSREGEGQPRVADVFVTTQEGDVLFALRRADEGTVKALWVDGDEFAQSAVRRLARIYAEARAVSNLTRDGYVLESARNLADKAVELTFVRQEGEEELEVTMEIAADGETTVEQVRRDRAHRVVDCQRDLAATLESLGVEEARAAELTRDVRAAGVSGGRPKARPRAIPAPQEEVPDGSR